MDAELAMSGPLTELWRRLVADHGVDVPQLLRAEKLIEQMDAENVALRARAERAEADADRLADAIGFQGADDDDGSMMRAAIAAHDEAVAQR